MAAHATAGGLTLGRRRHRSTPAARPANRLAVEAEPFEWAGAKRVVLIPLDDSWLEVRGSAWQEDVAFADPATAGYAFAAVVASVDTANRFRPGRSRWT